MYGITETTVHVSYRPLVPQDALLEGPSPIGGPLPDLSVRVLDRALRPVPIGVTGEISPDPTPDSAPIPHHAASATLPKCCGWAARSTA